MAGFVVLTVLLSVGYVLDEGRNQGSGHPKPVILYVNQGNGIVNGSGFGVMLSFASSHGFNTVFFQVYRQGILMFSSTTLQSFVTEAHGLNLSLFFALYIIDSTHPLPASIYGLGEDGVSLDMSGLSGQSQLSLLNTLKASYDGITAVTTTDMGSTLKPDWLVLETYFPQTKSYINHGIIASVGVFATNGQEDYQSQYDNALLNSDGVMVFDYYGLVTSGY